MLHERGVVVFGFIVRIVRKNAEVHFLQTPIYCETRNCITFYRTKAPISIVESNSRYVELSTRLPSKKQ